MKVICVIGAGALLISIIYGHKRKTACKKRDIEKKAAKMGYELRFDDIESPEK